MNRVARFLVFNLFAAAVLPAAMSAQNNRSLRGAWVAQTYIARGRMATEPPRGIALFFDSTYSFVAEMWPRRAAGDTLTGAEKIEAYDGFLSSAGSYRLVGDTLTTRAYIHLDPLATRAWPNRARSYRIQIKGDTLHWDFGDRVGIFRRMETASPR
jgi:hypothetical protein